jgi:hypothetical protein
MAYVRLTSEPIGRDYDDLAGRGQFHDWSRHSVCPLFTDFDEGPKPIRAVRIRCSSRCRSCHIDAAGVGQTPIDGKFVVRLSLFELKKDLFREERGV